MAFIVLLMLATTPVSTPLNLRVVSSSRSPLNGTHTRTVTAPALSLIHQRLDNIVIPSIDNTTDASSSLRQNGTQTRIVQPSQCRPAHQFVFVKTHKSGSSTLSMLLIKYMQKHGLRPAIGRGVNGASAITDSDLLRESFDASITHIIWKETLATSFYTVHGRWPTFTILRDPLARFQSAFHFFPEASAALMKVYGLPHVLNSTTFSHLLTMLHRFPSRVARIQRKHGMQIFSSVPLDLGLAEFNMPWYWLNGYNTALLEPALEKLDTRLDLVLLTDKWAQSLAVLRRFLCWEMQDMVWLSFKNSTNTDRNYQSLDPTSHDINLFRSIFQHEYTMYDRYRTRFNNRYITPHIQAEAHQLQRLFHEQSTTNANLRLGADSKPSRDQHEQGADGHYPARLSFQRLLRELHETNKI
eukprot:m.17594 g.17594  ORF g.17594 m.17594 type:complete len:413 (-) comp7513_c0_seq1:25-1263(-)